MKISLISDFNIEPLALYLRKSLDDGSDVMVAPFGQWTQCLLDAGSELWEPRPDVCLIWTQPEAALPAIRASLAGSPVSDDAVHKDAGASTALFLSAAPRARNLLVASWALPFKRDGGGLGGFAGPAGPAAMLAAANLHLLAACRKAPNAAVLNSADWLLQGGTQAFSPRHWYGAKVPFVNEVFKAAAQDIISFAGAANGRARKLIILDLDDTLWGGIAGDVGSEGIVLGGHDPVGEALVDFQHELKALSRRGIALGLVSKNTEALVLDILENHPEMILRPRDFAGWRINWSDKAQNVAELAGGLNLGLDSIVFIDDNPAERQRVKAAFPDVLVPEWPVDKRLYPQALRELNCFQTLVATAEDRQRTAMYVDERRRGEARKSAVSVEDWIAGLEMDVEVSGLNRGNLPRVSQLLNKTNQMNLSTRRVPEAELWEWAAAGSRRCWAFRLRDRFGDSGIVGLLTLEEYGERADIVDFVLSCRVMGRRVEEMMLHIASQWAARRGLKVMRAIYRRTEKNAPCLAFFKTSGMREEGDGMFLWPLVEPYPACGLIRLSGLDDRERAHTAHEDANV